MGSDMSTKKLNNMRYVSIHAPTWGATVNGVNADYTNKVSIHAPTWGATLLMMISTPSRPFQSTLPHGERLTPLLI